MTKIGFDAKRAFKNFSGLGNYSRSLIGAMADYYTDNQYYLYTPPYTAHPALTGLVRENVLIRCPQGLQTMFPAWWRSRGIAKDLLRDQIDLFHGLSGELPMGASKLPMVVTMHDVIFMRYPQYYKPLDRSIYEKKFRYACRRADRIIAISQQTADDIKHFLGADPQKIRIVYQGCDPQFYKKATTEICQAVRLKYTLPEDFILCVGTIEERKNLVNLVRSLALLPKELHLVAIGKATPYVEEVNKTIAQLGLGARVHTLHNAAFSDFPAMYQCAKVIAYPSVFEGFGIPVLEGLNAGVPVVTSNLSSMPEAGGEAAAYINPLEPEDIADKIDQILSDSALAASMIAKGYAHALKFREDKVAKNMMDVYSELIQL